MYPPIFFLLDTNHIDSLLNPDNIPNVEIEKKIVIYDAIKVKLPKISMPKILVKRTLEKIPKMNVKIVFIPLFRKDLKKTLLL